MITKEYLLNTYKELRVIEHVEAVQMSYSSTLDPIGNYSVEITFHTDANDLEVFARFTIHGASEQFVADIEELQTQVGENGLEW